MKKTLLVIIAVVGLCTAGYAQSTLSGYHSSDTGKDMYVKVSAPEEDGSFNYYVEVNNLLGEHIDDAILVINNSEVDAIKAAINKARTTYNKKAKAASRKGNLTTENKIKVEFPNVNIRFQLGNKCYPEISTIIAYFEAQNGQCTLALYGIPEEKDDKLYSGYSLKFSSDADFDSFFKCFDIALANEHFAKQQEVEALFN